MAKEPFKCPRMHRCPHYRHLKVIKKYIPSIINEVLTSTLNDGTINERVKDILKRLMDKDNDCSD